MVESHLPDKPAKENVTKLLPFFLIMLKKKVFSKIMNWWGGFVKTQELSKFEGKVKVDIKLLCVQLGIDLSGFLDQNQTNNHALKNPDWKSALGDVAAPDLSFGESSGREIRKAEVIRDVIS